jgi:ATPase family associated with various cellular activities (AAA)
VQDSPLLRYDLMQYVTGADTTFLNQSIKLSDELIDYLLAEQPTPDDLKTVLRYRLQPMQPSLLSSQAVNVAWEALILPEKQRSRLQRLVDLAKVADGPATGSMAVLAGASGTGKTLVAQAIATALNTPLVSVDLATLEPETYPQLLQELSTTAPTVLLIRSGERWLRRSSSVSAVGLQRWFEARQRQPGLTLFSVTHAEAVALTWLKQMLPAVVLPRPQIGDRLLLWQRSIPSNVTPDPALDWPSLAQQLVLTGGEIQAIAQTAMTLMAAANTTELSLETLMHAIEQHGYRLKTVPRQVEPKKRRSPRTKTSTKPQKSKPDNA